METKEGTPVDGVKKRTSRTQLVALAVLIVIGIAVFLFIKNTNDNHSYRAAAVACREHIDDRLGWNNGIRINFVYGDNGPNDKTDGAYSLPVTLKDLQGNEETAVCIATYHAGNWDVYVL